MSSIIFICGSAEPGKDGVGDYTLRLAGELISRGNQVRIIAVRDKFIEESRVESLSDSRVKVEVLRLASVESVKTRMGKATKFAKKVNPDWISLQFVPYAFSSQGIPVGLGKAIRAMSSSAQVHVMVHESYLTGSLSPKNKLVKIGQIQSIKSMMKVLNPKVIHTSIPSYQTLLANIGIHSELLGLFGNLPFAATSRNPSNPNCLKAVFFGIGPVEIFFDVFSKRLKKFSESSSIQIELIFCGNPGDIGRRFIQYVKDAEIHNLVVNEMGRMGSEDLSKLFLSCDFGIARVPTYLLGKSGTAISMLEHGLPMWIPLAESQSEIASNFDFRKELCFFDLKSLAKQEMTAVTLSRLPEITTVFESSLNKRNK